MSAAIDPRLQRLLGDDRFASLRKRLRRRFERAPLALFGGFRIDQLTVDEHAALASLRAAQAATRVLCKSMWAVSTSHSGMPASRFRCATHSNKPDGPIAHLATTRLALQMMWSDVLENSTHDALIELLQTPAGMGLLKRLTRQNPTEAIQICRRIEATLERLPAKGITCSQLAADAPGDPHGLDSGQPAATLVLTILRRLIARVDGKDNIDDPADNQELELAASVERGRDIWARAGVLVNELARPVF